MYSFSNSSTCLSQNSNDLLLHQNFSSFNTSSLLPTIIPPQQQQQPPLKMKKKRNLPGNPDPEAEVIALSPKTLMATNRFVCEVCNKGFQRDQNLQLHRRGHNLPWKLKQRNKQDVKKKAYVCPEISCVHHHPSRALGDLTGIKKHFCRKHGEKKWKCHKCSKIYAVQSDWKAHSKTCGTREYRCDCGTLFSRKDSFITHRAFCDALAEESARLSASHHQFASSTTTTTQSQMPSYEHLLLDHDHRHQIQTYSSPPPPLFPFPWDPPHQMIVKPETHYLLQPSNGNLSATALLQKAATIGTSQQQTMTGQQVVDSVSRGYMGMGMGGWQKRSDGQTRDFLGLARHNGKVNVSMELNDMLLNYTRGCTTQIQPHGFAFDEPQPTTTSTSTVSQMWG